MGLQSAYLRYLTLYSLNASMSCVKGTQDCWWTSGSADLVGASQCGTMEGCVPTPSSGGTGGVIVVMTWLEGC